MPYWFIAAKQRKRFVYGVYQKRKGRSEASDDRRETKLSESLSSLGR